MDTPVHLRAQLRATHPGNDLTTQPQRRDPETPNVDTLATRPGTTPCPDHNPTTKTTPNDQSQIIGGFGLRRRLSCSADR